MNKHLDEYLCKKYPKIFRDRTAPMDQTCMCWGFSHGDGWFFLIDRLCSSIQNHIDQQQEWVLNYGIKTWTELAIEGKSTKHLDINPIPQVVAAQVKEKFGGLRFYIDGGDAEIRGMINFAESLSYRICEVCGKMDNTVTTEGARWIRSLCSSCRKPDDTGRSLSSVTNSELNDAVNKAIAEGAFTLKNENTGS